MKKLLYLPLILCALILSCDAQDEAEELIDIATGDDTDDTPPVINSYFSLTDGDTWQYDVVVDAMEPQQDNLEASGSIVANGQPYTDFQANTESIGFMTNLFAGGGLREENAQLEYTGSITIPLDDVNEIVLAIPSITMYDEAIGPGIQIDQTEQMVTQEIDGVPVTVSAIITTFSGGLSQNVTVNDNTFANVLNASFTVNATITATISGISVTVLEPQDVIIATNTYAQNIGLVNSDLDFMYEFVDLTPFGITLPFPQTTSNEVIQSVTTYEVAGDN